jgi:Interferon-induced transmembrane protein
MRAYRAKGLATMSYGDNPVDEQDHDTGQAFGAPPSYVDQPGYGEPGSMPPTYRSWQTIAFVCGFLFNAILGLPAASLSRWYSGRVPPLWANGNVLAAVQMSRRARAWLIVSFVLDVLGIILLVVAFQGPRSNFNNPSDVAASLKTLVQQRLSDSSSPYYAPGVTVTSVVCTRAGTKTDHCVLKYSDGKTEAETATISGNGSRYITK